VMLEVRDVRKEYGGVVALDNCTFTLAPSTITGLIGPNGAGKTTLFNIITGMDTPQSGEVLFQGRRIDGLPPFQVTRLGIGRTFQITRLFFRMTALENLLIVKNPGEQLHSSVFPTRKAREAERENRERCLQLLELVGLTGQRDTPAGNLSYGQQKLLELARILALDASLVLLDEPLAGVNPLMRRKLLDLIKKLREAGKTFLVIEHDIRSIMDLCDRIIVLDCGQKIAEGTPREIQQEERVINAYLGEGNL